MKGFGKIWVQPEVHEEEVPHRPSANGHNFNLDRTLRVSSSQVEDIYSKLIPGPQKYVR